MGTTPPSTSGRETSGLTTKLIVRYVRHHAGEDGVQRLLELAGEKRSVERLEEEREWFPYETKIALLGAAVAVLGDPSAPRHIGEWALDSQVGTPVRVVLSLIGSPAGVLKSIASAGSKFTTNATYETVLSGRSRATITYRLHDGYRPSSYDCQYTAGLLAQVPVLFGLPPARVAHPQCMVSGDPHCAFDVSWKQVAVWWSRLLPSGYRLRRARVELQTMTEQLAEMQEAVTDLVSHADIDEVLHRIARRARSAVHALGYVLSVRLPGDRAPRVHVEGVPRDRAEQFLEAVREGLPTAEFGHHLSADIASTRVYGRLVAFQPAGQEFLPKESELLQAYAKLAAAALDSALALERSRRRERTASALLRLATDLARTTAVNEVGDRVAAAMPDVLGCDRAVIMGLEATAGRLVVLGAGGWPAELEGAVRAFSISADDTSEYSSFLTEPGPRVYGPQDDDPFVAEVCRAFGVDVVAVVPVLDRDRMLGVMLAGWSPDTSSPEINGRLFSVLDGLAGQASSALVRTQLLGRARHQATHDPLTSLPNRRLFEDLADLASARWRRTGERFGLLFIDIDGFKEVNDTLGHVAGDEVLGLAARRLQDHVRATDVVARYGGDEFVVLVAEAADAGDMTTVVDKLLGAFELPFELAAGRVELGVSIGIAVVPDDGETVQELLRLADARMYEAKLVARGRA